MRFSRVEILSRGARPVTVAASSLAPDDVAALTSARPRLTVGRVTLAADHVHVVGILNVTPDSFSDGGSHADAARAVAAAHAMAAAGASIVDIGAESTRPGALPVSEDEELARLEPVLEGLAESGLVRSIDTRKAKVMARALAGGAGMVNDVSGLTHDTGALKVVAAARCAVVAMHARGAPATMQDAPAYDDVLLDIYDWLAGRIEVCVAAGIERSQIIVDPGIGFGKTLEHNLALLRGLGLFHGLGCPVMLGASRKQLIGTLAGGRPTERLGGSIAIALAAARQGVQFVRVHDVAATVQALRIQAALD